MNIATAHKFHQLALASVVTLGTFLGSVAITGAAAVAYEQGKTPRTLDSLVRVTQTVDSNLDTARG